MRVTSICTSAQNEHQRDLRLAMALGCLRHAREGPGMDPWQPEGTARVGGGGIDEPPYFPLAFAVNLKTRIKNQLRVSKTF